MSSLVQTAVTYATWAYLPRYLTGTVQHAYYQLRPGRTPPPKQGTPEHARDRRRVYVCVVTAYFLFTIWSAFADIQRQGDMYRLLGVTPLTPERVVRSRYRRMATLLHPDKISKDSSDTGGPGAEAAFMSLKVAYETLTDPTQRFVYDRFGEAIVLNERLPEAERLQKLILAALAQIAPQRLLDLALLLVLNLVWFPAWGRFWRLYAFCAALVAELILLTSVDGTLVPAAHLPAWLVRALGLESAYLLPFQSLGLLNRASSALSIYISHVAPSAAEIQAARGGKAVLHPPLEAHIVRLLGLLGETDKAAERCARALRGEDLAATEQRESQNEAGQVEAVEADQRQTATPSSHA
ncbi:hypothetical protein KEM52_004695 [Ascosphaera acerosa]|nr:hypothetical protein KEM52_004695 [Ascosphaera acerosa]